MKTLGTRIREWRLAKGLSQEELSDGICSASTISQIELDKISPSFKLVKELSLRLEVTLDELAYGGKIEQQLEQARRLMTEEKFYDALELLRGLEKYDSQQEMQFGDVRLQVNYCIGSALDKRNTANGGMNRRSEHASSP